MTKQQQWQSKVLKSNTEREGSGLYASKEDYTLSEHTLEMRYLYQAGAVFKNVRFWPFKP